MTERRASAKKGGRARGASSSSSEGRHLSDLEFRILCGVVVAAIVVLANRVMQPSGPGSDAGRDENANCVFWATQGECARNPVYMLNHCRRSCHATDDELAAGGLSAGAGASVGAFPHPDPHAMSNHPPVNLSAISSHSREQCEAWKARGDCEISVPFMQLHCASVCAYGPVDLQRHCRYWAQNGECTRSSAFMRLQCPASCEPFFEGLKVINSSSTHEEQQAAAANRPEGAADPEDEAGGAGAGGSDGGAAAVGEISADVPSAGARSSVSVAVSHGGGRGAHASPAFSSFRVGLDLLKSPICMPLGDHRPDCETIVKGGHCHDATALETLQRCFLSCSSHEPEVVLHLLRRYPDPSPLQAIPHISPLDSHGVRTTLKSLCMGGENRPAHEPQELWRRRLLLAFGPRAFTLCSQW
jgi:hypothetical protein